MDIHALRDALAAPGLDPRYWVRLGQVLSVAVKDDDGNALDYVELTIAEWPERSTTICPLMILGGLQGSSSLPIKQDDMVLIFYPDGEEHAIFALGPIRTADIHQAVLDNIGGQIEHQFEDIPVENHYNSVDTTLEKGITITAKGDNAVVAVPDTKMVQLGGAGASDPVVKHDELKTAWSGLVTTIGKIETELNKLDSSYAASGISTIDSAASSKVKVDK